MDNYEVVSEIGRGSFGRICKVRRRSDNKVLAWKEINYASMGEKEKMQLVAEVNILRDIKHTNVVRYYERLIDKENMRLYIIMEYCDGGDLTTVLKKLRLERKYMEEDAAWRIFSQVVLALHACHRREGGVILHRDIKPDNILMDSQQNVKLGDFGLSRVLGSKHNFAQTFLGTPFYMSPEQVQQQNYNEKSDIWSLGCLLYEMCALTPPFNASNLQQLHSKIVMGKVSRLPPCFSDDINNLVQRMLEIDPAQRPDVEALMQVPQVKLHLRERKVQQHYLALKKKEDALRELEQSLDERERALAAREAALDDRARQLDERSAMLGLHARTRTLSLA